MSESDNFKAKRELLLPEDVPVKPSAAPKKESAAEKLQRELAVTNYPHIPIKPISEDAIMLVNQGTKVKIKGQEIHIETPKIEIQTEKIHITGEVEIDKELTVKGIKFTPHVHKEVAKGGDKSGPPEGSE